MNFDELKLEAQDLNQQAALLIKVGNFEEAKSRLDQAIEVEPMLMDSYKNYGDLYMGLQQFEDAKNSYRKALLVEKVPVLYFLYGNACFMNNEPHEGLEYYNQAITAGYDSDEMMFFMGMAYEHLNDDGMALRYFQRACIKNPSRPDYLIKKISAQLRLDMIDGAEQSVDELLTIAPELYDGYHIKTQLLINSKQYEEAVEFSKKATERFPEDADLMHDYIKCVALSKEYDLALSLVDQAKKMKYYEEAKIKLIILEAEIAAESGDYDRAMKCCEECIALENEEFFAGEARFMLMNLHFAKPDFEKSLDHANALVVQKQEDVYYYAALYYKGFCLKKLGKDEDARTAYLEANSIYRLETLKHPEALDIYLYRAMCLKDLEEYDRAHGILDFILGVASDIAEVHTIRADIYRAQGKKSKANEEMEKAYKIKPELRNTYEGIND